MAAPNGNPAAAGVQEVVVQPSPVRVAAGVGYRTVRSVAISASRPLRPVRQHPEIRTRVTTPKLAALVLLDEVALALIPSSTLVPNPAWLQTVSDETESTALALETNGWITNPASFHQAPTPPSLPVLTPDRFGHIRHQVLKFHSGYQPAPGVPGGDRWLALGANQHVHAYVMRHRRGPRPWLVLLHGYTGGSPADLLMYRALHFHRDLGFNVIQPALPLHGPRRVGAHSGSGFISFDYTANLHAVAQGVWDVRRCIAWARGEGATSVSVMGVSLGGYMASLVAGVEDDLDRVVAGVPMVDVAWALGQRAPRHEREIASRYALLDERLEAIHRVITPLSYRCRVRPSGRFIFAGISDRFIPPRQVSRLWRHWDRPSIMWYAGSHVGVMMSRQVHSFVDVALTRSLG